MIVTLRYTSPSGNDIWCVANKRFEHIEDLDRVAGITIAELDEA